MRHAPVRASYWEPVKTCHAASLMGQAQAGEDAGFGDASVYTLRGWRG